MPIRFQIEAMERSAASTGFVGSRLFHFLEKDEDEIISYIPRIRHPQVVDAVGEWLALHHIKKAVPLLIKAMDRVYSPTRYSDGPPAMNALRRFGYDAVSGLLQTAACGPPFERLCCAKLLIEDCAFRPLDPKLPKAIERLASDPDPRLRFIAVDGLWAAAYDDVHREKGGFTLNFYRTDLVQKAFDLAYDQDKGIAEHARTQIRAFLSVGDRSIPFLTNDPVDYGQLDTLRPKILSLTHAPSAEVRAAALVFEDLSYGLDSVRIAALSDPDPLVFHTAIIASRTSIDERVLPRLIAQADSENPQVRRGVAILLRASESPTARPPLEKLLHDKVRAVREAAKPQAERRSA